MTYQCKPGDIGLTQISGDVGKLIRLGQKLNGNGFSVWEHAFVVVDDFALDGKTPVIVEAEPGGAKYTPLHYSDVWWCEGIAHGLTDAEREEISDDAVGFVGTGYSFLDYFALAGKRLRLPHALVDAYVKSTHHMICSQLAAAAYDRAGKPIYPYWSGDVTPGDLYQKDLELRAKYGLPLS